MCNGVRDLIDGGMPRMATQHRLARRGSQQGGRHRESLQISDALEGTASITRNTHTQQQRAHTHMQPNTHHRNLASQHATIKKEYRRGFGEIPWLLVGARVLERHQTRHMDEMLQREGPPHLFDPDEHGKIKEVKAPPHC